MEWVLVPLGFFVLSGFIMTTAVNSWQRHRQAKLMADFNTRLLERIGSFKDFSDFLQTSGGAAFMTSLTAERGGTTGPRAGLLRAVQIGVVLVVLGAGLLALAAYFSRGTSLSPWNNVSGEVFLINGVIALSLGAGFLLASTVSYGVARKLGLLQPTEGHDVLPMV